MHYQDRGLENRVMPEDKGEIMEEGTCVVHVVDSKFEADIIAKVLEREGVPYVCRKHEETAYDGIFVPQRGWGAILVPISLREKAMEIIEQVRKTYPEEMKP
jgi:hypothetical protein